MKLTITQLGTPKTYVGAKGPFEKNWLKAKEYGSNYLNFWLNPTSKAWQVGQTIEVEAVEERKYTAKDGTEKTSYDIKLSKLNGGGNNAEVLEAIRQLRYQVDVKMIPLLTALCKEIVPEAPKTELDYPERTEEPKL